MKVVPENKGSGRIFKNKFLEKLTRTHILFPIVVFIGISVLLFVYGIKTGIITLLNAPLLFGLGFVSFTLVEYFTHRYIFHLIPKNEAQEDIVYKIHGVHHHYPKDRVRLAMPVPLSITISTGFYIIFWLIMDTYVYGFLPGFLFGYAYYLSIHYVVHAYRPPKNFLKIFWVHHGIHHYKDPENAFGVTSPFWDYVFNTMPKISNKKI